MCILHKWKGIGPDWRYCVKCLRLEERERAVRFRHDSFARGECVQLEKAMEGWESTVKEYEQSTKSTDYHSATQKEYEEKANKYREYVVNGMLYLDQRVRREMSL